jgi:hypothetical protein
VDKENAWQLLQSYHTKPCPIHLENFDDSPWDKMEEASSRGNNNTMLQSSGAMKLVNS